MNRLVLIALICSASFATFTFAADRAPNVVLIISDDQGWTDFGFMGHKTIQTPNLDRLAAQAAVFPNGYVPTSLCRASLASIMTGLYPHQHKICCNDQPNGMPRESMWGFLKGLPTIPRNLAARGYLSFQTGKFWEGHFENGGFTHGMTVKGRHGDDGLAIGRQTMQPMYDFMQTARKQDKPFFLWYAPMLPHQPHNPPADLLKKYQKPDLDPGIAKYYAMCEWFDKTCGELLDYLDKNQLSQNTIVIMIVDNGWIQIPGPRQPNPQKFQGTAKNTPYDGGLRTPIVIKWPDRIQPARYSDLASSIDLAPTILAAAGAAPSPDMPGLNLLDVATGRKPRLDRTGVFGEIFIHTSLDVNNPARNLAYRWTRQGDWKLIVPAAHAPDQAVRLYQLTEDPFEKTNLSDSNPAKIKELRATLDAWWKGE